METNHIIKLKVVLKDLPHICEPTLLVPDNINMRQLHFVIQDAFYWHNAHFFEFCDSASRPTVMVGVPNDKYPEQSEDHILKAYKINLKKMFREGRNGRVFWYWYDFGDDWWHQISILKVTQKDAKLYRGVPICTKAVGKCPSEDCGGPWGYADLLYVLKNKKHPDYLLAKEWCCLEPDETYDETEVDMGRINHMLNSLYNSTTWTSNMYLKY